MAVPSHSHSGIHFQVVADLGGSTCRLTGERPAFHRLAPAVLGLLCSRHNPAFLQRTGTGSHLYPAYLHTMRQVSSRVVLLTPVGLTASASPLSLPLCFKYTTLLATCQALFLIFFEPSCRPPPFSPKWLLVHIYYSHNRTPCEKEDSRKVLHDSRGSCGSLPPSPSLIIVQHRDTQKSTGNYTQIAGRLFV